MTHNDEGTSANQSPKAPPVQPQPAVADRTVEALTAYRDGLNKGLMPLRTPAFVCGGAILGALYEINSRPKDTLSQLQAALQQAAGQSTGQNTLMYAVIGGALGFAVSRLIPAAKK